ncbi:YfiM family protein [Flavobacteriaceae bacterium F08102]|nr:YfiM family protein [Flavobacteriaceae bacterium F08102]
MKLKLTKALLLILFTSTCIWNSQAQQTWLQKADSLNSNRLKTVYLTEIALTTTTLIGVQQLWYAGYPKSSFHTINDTNHWLQMDKVGHAFSAYYIGKLGMNSLAWAGASPKSQILYGATLGFAFLTAVEIMDGYSAEWGFSASDLVANALGSGILIGQALWWKEQRIQFKYSFHQTHFATIRPERLGENLLEQTLKDYNGQTYWLSINLWSFHKTSKLPKWFNVAFGYGAEGLLYGDRTSQPLQITNDYPERERQFYLSIDLDLTKIKTQSKWLKAVFNTLNFIKIPAPTFQISTKGKPKLHLLYF